MTSVLDLHGPPHVQRYLDTDGEEGYRWRNGSTVLLLFTTGRKSGEERINALIFQPVVGRDDAYTVIASKGGADQPPSWFLNLQARPEAQVQIKADRFPVRARVATPEEKPALWARMADVWPDYDEYQRSTDREIPVVVLERA